MNRYIQSFLALLPPANEVWGKVIFSEACVKNSVHRGRGSTWAGTPRNQVHPRVGTPPWGPGTPNWAGTPPRTRYTPLGPGIPPQDQVHCPPGTKYTSTGQVHPPGAVHAGRYRQQASGTHPTGIHSCSQECIPVGCIPPAC